MNNTQFRRLVLDTPNAASTEASEIPSRSGPTTSALGSRMRSSIPMTPRSVAASPQSDFARQVFERDSSLKTPSTRKPHSTSRPKGTKLAPGYTDRTQQRISEDEDDKAKRVKSLEEMVKLGQMDHATFEALRDEIVGGDLRNVHLVKGLDRKLLERIRGGEDVLSGDGNADKGGSGAASVEVQAGVGEAINVDREFEQLAEKEVKPITKAKDDKKGEMASAKAGKKRTRDDILKELRASRQPGANTVMAQKVQPPGLGSRFVKLGERREKSRIERDERGKEILITVDESGKVKRKVRKAKKEELPGHGLLMPDKDAKPLGMEVVDPTPMPEAKDVDIFEGVGADYDPLGTLEDDEDDSDHDSDKEEASEPNDGNRSQSAVSPSIDQASMPPPPLPVNAALAKRNYFLDAKTKSQSEPEVSAKPLEDPTILAALRKASTLRPLSPNESGLGSNEEAEKLARRKKMLENQDRDAEDMDLGFGSSRFGDEEEPEGKKIKLSVWGEEAGEKHSSARGEERRKRGPKKKKKKGDVNSAADVLQVMQRRKAKD